MDALVVLGTVVDPHVEIVVDKVRRHEGAKVIVLDYSCDTDFSVSVDAWGALELTVNGDALKSFVVWDRRKIIPGTELYVRGDEEHSGYIAQEWRALYTLLAGVAAEKATNRLAARSCMIKPYQQMVAAEVGLKSPTTLVTNSKSGAIRFERQAGGVILKSLSGAKIQTRSEGEDVPFNVMTMRVSREDLSSADQDSLACCPHFFQQEILKSHELRVVCVDEEVFAFRVESQGYESTKVDWRKAIDVVGFSAVDIDGDLRGRLLAFMRRMGLSHGSIDLIVDTDGSPWFLECNQDGAWGWLDCRNGGKISDAIARSLLRLMSADAEPKSETVNDEKDQVV